jgi:hypothetical protein
MLSLPHELRIANAAAVLHGPHGEVTQRAHQLGLSRQARYRDTSAVLQTLHGHDTQRQLQQLHEQADALRHRVAELETLLANAFLLDDDRLAAFASTAQAEGVSLPVCRRLLVPLMDKPLAEPPAPKRQPPSVAQLGRITQEAARRSTALLAVLDDFRRQKGTFIIVLPREKAEFLLLPSRAGTNPRVFLANGRLTPASLPRRRPRR